MSAIFRSKKADVLSHWYTLVPGFNTSAQEFYGTVEEELKARQVPGLQMSRVDFSEGGLLSDKRTYLRMARERLVFDVCAAPFGTSFFFSCRFAELPLAVKLSDLLFLLLAGVLLAWLSWHFLGYLLGTLAIAGILLALSYVLRNAVAMGLGDLDSFLLKSAPRASSSSSSASATPSWASFTRRPRSSSRSPRPDLPCPASKND